MAGWFDVLRRLLGWWSSPEEEVVETVAEFPPVFGSESIFYSLLGSDSSFHPIHRP